MSQIGNPISAATTYHVVATSLDNQFGLVLPSYVAPANGYVTRIGCFARQQAPATTRYVWLAIYDLDTNGEPLNLLGYTDRLPLGGTAIDISGPIAWSDPDLNGALTAVRLTQGQAFAIVAKIEAPAVGWVEFGCVTIAGTVTHYRKTHATLNTPPSDPFGAHSAVQGPEIAFYVDFSENLQPAIVLVSPADHAVIASTTPTFVADFTDPQNGAPTFDKMASYELEVTRVSDGAVMWGGPSAVFPSSFSERSASELTRVYTGAALTPGATVYRWRANVRDDSGLASNWSGYRDFTVNALGVVNTALDGLPVGVQDGDTSLLDFTGRWVHPTGLPMTQVQVFIYKDGVLFRKSNVVTGFSIASSASPGTLFTVFHGSITLGTIPPGTYGYTIQGKASDGQLSPESDPRRIFNANARPTTPSNLHPPSGSSSSTLPLFEWNVDDPDDFDVFGVDADSELEITRPDNSVATITTTNWDSVRGVGFWQATLAVFNQFGAYKVRVRGRDTSAGALGIGAWSSQIVFTFTAGLVVTITNPTEDEVFATSVPTIAWTVSGGTQATAVFTFYRQSAPSVPIASGQINSGVTSFQAPIGILVNGGAYEVMITASTAIGVTGSSLRRQFTVLFTAPDALTNVNATGVAERHDLEASPSSMLVSWDITNYPLGEFAGYVLRRRKASELPSQAIVLRTLKTPGQNQWRDYWVESRTVMIYGVSQLRRVGGVILESPIVEVSAQLVLAVPILVHATEPSIRFPLMYCQTDYSMSSSIPTALYTTWGSHGRPTAVTAPPSSRTRKAHVGLTIIGDSRGTLYDHMADYEQMMAIGGPFLLRTERPEEQFYCKIAPDSAPSWKRGSGVGTRIVALDLVEVDFAPGEQGGS